VGTATALSERGTVPTVGGAEHEGVLISGALPVDLSGAGGDLVLSARAANAHPKKAEQRTHQSPQERGTSELVLQYKQRILGCKSFFRHEVKMQ
jgi:hypothetical protein